MENREAMNTQLRAELHTLSRVLRNLHKVLIDVETQYFGTVGSPLEHLQLVTNHPHFLWLQKFSGLMAELDERLDLPEDIDMVTAGSFRTALEMLVGPRAASDEVLRKKYNALLQDSPELMMAHGELRKALGALPKLA